MCSGRSVSGEDIPVLRPEHIRELPERQALVIAENGRPIIARLSRCIDGTPGRRLLAEQHLARTQLEKARDAAARHAAGHDRVVDRARRLGLAPAEGTDS
jgi:type IV secretion system protein VirD4